MSYNSFEIDNHHRRTEKYVLKYRNMYSILYHYMTMMLPTIQRNEGPTNDTTTSTAMIGAGSCSTSTSNKNQNDTTFSSASCCAVGVQLRYIIPANNASPNAMSTTTTSSTTTKTTTTKEFHIQALECIPARMGLPSNPNTTTTTTTTDTNPIPIHMVRFACNF